MEKEDISKLLDLICEREKDLLPVVQWTGMTKDTLPSKEDLLRIYGQMPEEQRLAMLKFYLGDQWDERIRTERHQQGRPCLTINKLPALARIIDIQEGFRSPYRGEIEVALTFLNADAQRVFNYQVSCLAEAMSVMLCPEKKA